MPMNFYNPYFSMAPYANMGTNAMRGGLFRGLLRGTNGINWSSILNNTQRTLGIINQAIPVVKQITPVMRNAKTMFQVMNEFKKVDSPTPSTSISTTNTSSSDSMNTTASSITTDSQPTFFL